MAKRSILAIILFIVIYFILFVLAIALTALCGYVGIFIITARPSFYTLIAGLGIISIGFLILFFLIKFMFTSHKIDRSHLMEIQRKDQPQLFGFIDETVLQVQTDFPKKVYLSSDVNASVFYDSNFWSMFLPIKKNLQIGMGLVNSVSVTEFKAILAHEFGHFSQRTMKVGSYVYNVNQIIYNILYDNSSFENLISKLANIHGIITLFVRLALAIVSGIQWILKKIYAILNLNYMALSREMEYHADEVAANVAGSEPLISSLLRLDLANFSLDKVLSFYNNKIESAVKTTDLYPQQHCVMNFFAKEVELQIENQLPHVPIEHLSKYNKSKLLIKDQWSSHPSTKDRVAALKQLSIPTVSIDHRIAIDLFDDLPSIKSAMTKLIFSTAGYKAEEQLISTEEFMAEFMAESAKNSFPKVYRGYFDDKNPIYKVESDIDNTLVFDDLHINKLFSDSIMDLIYQSSSIVNDIEILKQLAEGGHNIKTFDYDGKKYTIEACGQLIDQLDNELKEIKDRIAKNDVEVLNYFNYIAKKAKKEAVWIEKYKYLASLDEAFEDNINCYNDVATSLEFIHVTTPFATIKANLLNLEPKEIKLKEKITAMLTDATYENLITDEVRKNLQQYVGEKHTYFWEFSNEYNDAALEILFVSLRNFQDVLLKHYFEAKRDLLAYQASLVTTS